MEDERKNGDGDLRIRPLNAGMMVFVAVVIDVIQWVMALFVIGIITSIITIVVNTLINAGAWLLFYYWFKLSKVSFVGPRQLLTMLGMGTGEVASAGIFPAWTIGVGLLVWMTYTEDMVKKETGKDIAITSKLAMASGKPAGAGASGAAKTAATTKLPPGAKPPVISPEKAAPGAVPPKIGGEIKPPIQRISPGAVPPKISDGKSPSILKQDRPLTQQQNLQPRDGGNKREVVDKNLL